jgi:hypothetical protein
MLLLRGARRYPLMNDAKVGALQQMPTVATIARLVVFGIRTVDHANFGDLFDIIN